MGWGVVEKTSCDGQQKGDFSGEVAAVWPDLAKFRHFGTILKVLGKC